MVLANGLNGSIVTYFTAFCVDKVAVVLAVNAHAAALAHIEYNAVHSSADDLVGSVRRTELNGRQRTIDFIMDCRQGLLLSGIRGHIWRKGYLHRILEIGIVGIVPYVIQDIERRYTAGNNCGCAKLTDGNSLPVFTRNRDGVSRQVIANG